MIAIKEEEKEEEKSEEERRKRREILEMVKARKNRKMILLKI